MLQDALNAIMMVYVHHANRIMNSAILTARKMVTLIFTITLDLENVFQNVIPTLNMRLLSLTQDS